MIVDNIFSINNPESVYCAIQHYVIGHSEMRISLNRSDSNETLYLSFLNVEYFSGPMRWTGANFSLRPERDCLALLREIGNYEDTTDELLLGFRPFKLYAVNRLKFPILILAATAEVIKS